MSRLTLEEYLANKPSEDFIDTFQELNTCVVPATGAAHKMCREINRMIDKGELCINPTTYRKVYLPTLAKYVQRELARRYVAALVHDEL